MVPKELPRAELLARFRYDPVTGKFTYQGGLMRSNGRRLGKKEGDSAGFLMKHGYVTLSCLDGRLVTAHRVAFLFMGQEPPPMVDHINGKRDDNRWENLRPSSASDNQLNRHRKAGRNQTLPIGISVRVRKGRPGVWFIASVEKEGVKKSTCRRRLEDALAYLAAAREGLKQ